MNVSAATSSTNVTATSSQGSGAPTGLNDMFMQLLVAQLKSQDPISPMDPTQFVGQLVDLNSLSELTKIRTLLTPAPTPTTGGK